MSSFPETLFVDFLFLVFESLFVHFLIQLLETFVKLNKKFQKNPRKFDFWMPPLKLSHQGGKGGSIAPMEQKNTKVRSP